MEAQAIAPAMYEWNDATFPACIAVAIALASITTNKDFNEAALALSSLFKKILQNPTTRIRHHSHAPFNGVIMARIIDQLKNAVHRACFLIPCTKHQLLNTCMNHGTNTHRTGF